MRRTVVANAVRRYGNYRIGLADAVIHCARGVVVVARICMRRPAEIQACQDLVLYACRRAGGGMWVAVISHAVWSNVNRGVGFGNAVIYRARGAVVVGSAGETPCVTVICTCIRV